jgi:hypothetical protein
LFLLMAGGMLIWGQTVLKSSLQDLWFILYWLVCTLFTLLALLIALLDLRAIGRRVRNEQRELVHRTLQDVERQNKNKKKRRP